MMGSRHTVQFLTFGLFAVLGLMNVSELFRSCSLNAFVSETTTMADYPLMLTSTASSTQQEEEQQDRWITYEQFANNQLVSSHPMGIGPPKEEDWLLDEMEHADPTTIPKRLFKVNILDHGGLQAIFEPRTTEFNASDPQDRAIKSLQQAHKSWPTLNPGYDIRYFDLHACRQYLKLHFHPIFLRTFDCIEAYGGKTNLFRYLVVYREGGWYSDWKEKCIKEGLLDMLSSGNTTWFSALNDANSRKCHQNAFFGAPAKHAVLSNAISRVLDNVQQKYYGVNVLSATGVCVLGAAVNQMGYGKDMENTARIGAATYSLNSTENVFRYHDEVILQHKCNDCGVKPDYDNGNNYWTKFKNREYYCPDASTLFGVPQADLEQIVTATDPPKRALKGKPAAKRTVRVEKNTARKLQS